MAESTPTLTTTQTRVVHVNDHIPDSIYIGRAMPARGIADSIWGNAYKIGRDGNRAQCIQGFAADLYKFKFTPSDIMHHLPDLRGKPLACWCRHDGEAVTAETKCHGDILVEALERYTDDELRSFGNPRPCPKCGGSGRAWVHDAFGAYGTTCRECDGTGIR
jgi:hypothetical protein